MPEAPSPASAPAAEYAIPRRMRAAGLALLLAATCIFFWPLFAGEPWHVPSGGGGDNVSFLWPTYSFSAETIRAGSWPLWNPYLFGGAPHAADNQSSLYYPPFLLLTAFARVPYRALEWMVLLHMFSAGAGMYTLLASLLPASARPHHRVSAAIAAALAFQFSSVFVTHIGNLNIVVVASYLPWAVWCSHKLQVVGGRRWLLALALCVALAFLGNHVQMFLFITVALIFHGAAGLFALRRSAARQSVRLVANYFLAALITTGLTAPSLLPGLEMLPQTLRFNFTYASASEYSLPPAGLAGMLSPLLFGRGPENFWADWDRVELGYAGLITLWLAALAVSLPRQRAFAIALGATGLVIALGKHTPVHFWMYEYIPGFNGMRVPGRTVLLTDFCFTLLAGIGLCDLLQRTTSVRRAQQAAVVLAALLLGGLSAGWWLAVPAGAAKPLANLQLAIGVGLATLLAAFSIPSAARWWGLPLLLAAELVGLGAWVETGKYDPAAGYRAGPAMQWLQAQPQPFRIDIATIEWQQDTGAINHIETVDGLDNPLQLARYHTYYWAVGTRGSPQYNFLNAKYLITAKNRPAAAASFVPVFNEDPLVDVYLNTGAIPRIQLIYDTLPAAGGEQAFAAVQAPAFDPLRTVVLEGGVPLHSAPPPGHELFYVRYLPTDQLIVARSATPAYLVFSEKWFPGWRAAVDGQPAEIQIANFAFRAVYIPAGEHTITMQFVPTSTPWGIAIMLLTVALLAGAALWQPVMQAGARRRAQRSAAVRA